MSESRVYLRFCLSLVFIFSILIFSSQNIFAHARWSTLIDSSTSLVTPRNNSNGLKTAECGGVARTDSPKVLQKGTEVEVQFTETTYHPGYFIISFSPAGDLGFDQNILLENIPHHANVSENIYTETITLPDIECTDCTLQLIQVMEDRDPPTNYYSCADIQLTATGLPPPPGEDTTPPADVSNLASIAGDMQATISWINPAADFFQILILQDTVSNIAMPMDTLNYSVGETIGSSKVIYTGSGTSLVAQDLMNGNDYRFKLFAYDASLNYSSGLETSVMLMASPINSAPTISLISEQSQAITTTIQADAGDVSVQIFVDDANPTDTHSYDWSATDNRLVDLDTAPSLFRFNPSGLSPDTYTVEVTVMDDGNPAMGATVSSSIVVVAASTNPAPNTGTTPKSSGGGAITGISLLILGMLFGLRRFVLRPK